MSNCYVIYTGVGRETAAERLIEGAVPPELYVRVFHSCRHMRKKIAGKWADIYEWLIPGYIFVLTDDIRGFSAAIRKLPRLLKLLGRNFDNGEPSFTPLTDEEVAWLSSVIGERWFSAGDNDISDGQAVAELSQIDFDENDNIIVLSGPLMNLSGKVRKINLHRREAEVEIVFMGVPQTVRLGVEIMTKK